MRPRGRKRFCRSIGFKKGQTNPSIKGQSRSCETPDVYPGPYVRTSIETFDSRINDDDGAFTFHDVDGQETPVKPLRPLKSKRRLLDSFSQKPESDIHPDLLVNKLYCPLYVQVMFNSETRNHRSYSPNCEGDLNIDAQNSKKWGLGWRERLLCTECGFCSEYHKLYEEVETKKRGRRSAKANVGLQIGLMSTPVSNTGACRILASSNVVPPSRSGMIKQSNRVSKSMVELNTESMASVRQALVAENELCGNKSPKAVNVEGDSCYNNPIFNSESTPFQAGTIVTTTFCENNTRDKKGVGVHVGSKLCIIGSRLRNAGEDVQCPNHAGQCTANLQESDVIGNEERWNSAVCQSVAADITITGFTGDGDSKGTKGVTKATSGSVKCFKDLRHLGNSLKRGVYKAPFSCTMFRGYNKSNMKNRFALSVKARCIAELKQAHKVYKHDLGRIKQALPNIKEAIIMCFKGYCGISCQKHSLVCKGNFRREKFFLPPNIKLKMTASDDFLLSRCMDVLLGPSNIALTAQLTTSQKCEAVNKSYQACNPKNITFARTCSGRIHGQILKLNQGTADSTLIKTSVLGAPLSKGSSVVKYLTSVHKRELIQRKPTNRARQRQNRYKTLARKYNLHAKLHYSKGLTDPKPNFSGMRHLQDHKYA